MSNLPPNQNYTQNSGSTSSQPFIIQFNARNPTAQDVNYSIQQPWKNTLTDEYWILQAFTSIGGVVVADWRKIGSGALGVEFLEGDTGGPVGPDVNHIINVIGGSAGVSTAGSGNTLEILVDAALLPYYSLTPYIVGQVGDVHAQFTGATAIQDAIDAAALAALPATILIKPGDYTENINVPISIALVASSQDGRTGIVKIIGTTTFSTAVAGANSAQGIQFVSTGGQPAVLSNPTAGLALSISNCTFLAQNGTGFSAQSNFVNANLDLCNFVPSAGQKNLELTNGSSTILESCNLSGADTASTVVSSILNLYHCLDSDFFIFTDANVGGLGNNFSNISSTLFTCSGTTNGAIFASFIQTNDVLAFDLSGTASFSFVGQVIVPGASEAAQVGAGCMLNCAYCAIVSFAPSGFYMTGNGTVLAQAVTPFGSANAIDPALSQSHVTLNMGNISFDGGATPVANDGELIIGNGTTGFPSIGHITSTDGSITVTNNPGNIDLSVTSSGGTVLQQVRTFTAASQTITNLMPGAFVNVAPTNTQGDQILSVNITPSSLTSVLVVEACLQSTANGNTDFQIAFFRDTDTSAFAANNTTITARGSGAMMDTMKAYVVSGTTSPITISLRGGPISPGTGMVINASIPSGTHLNGAAAFTNLIVTEFSS